MALPLQWSEVTDVGGPYADHSHQIGILYSFLRSCERKCGSFFIATQAYSLLILSDIHYGHRRSLPRGNFSNVDEVGVLCVSKDTTITTIPEC